MIAGCLLLILLGYSYGIFFLEELRLNSLGWGEIEASTHLLRVVLSTKVCLQSTSLCYSAVLSSV